MKTEFKKGDKVRIVAWNGYKPERAGAVCKVLDVDHSEYTTYKLLHKDGRTDFMPPCHLEAVQEQTPADDAVGNRVLAEAIRQGKAQMADTLPDADCRKVTESVIGHIIMLKAAEMGAKQQRDWKEAGYLHELRDALCGALLHGTGANGVELKIDVEAITQAIKGKEEA